MYRAVYFLSDSEQWETVYPSINGGGVRACGVATAAAVCEPVHYCTHIEETMTCNIAACSMVSYRRPVTNLIDFNAVAPTPRTLARAAVSDASPGRVSDSDHIAISICWLSACRGASLLSVCEG